MVDCSKSKERERESMCAVSERKKCERERVCYRNEESEFLKDEIIYRQSLICSRLQMRDIKIKGSDVVVSTNHVTFLTNRFPRLINLSTSVIFVSGTSGITAILKFRSVNPIISPFVIYLVINHPSRRTVVLFRP